MFSALKEVYAKVPVIVKAAPFLFLVPVVAEALQHIVEFQLGMFTVGDGISYGFESIVRMWFGVLKIATILFSFTWIPRFWFKGKEVKAALKISGHELKFMVGTAGMILVIILFIVFVGPLLTSFIVESGLGIPEKIRPFVPLFIIILLSHPAHNLWLWQTGGFLGDGSMTMTRSKACIKGKVNWATGVLLLSVGPAMVLHYYLNLQSVGAAFPVQLGFLFIDSILVGVMAVLLGNSIWVTYKKLASES